MDVWGKGKKAATHRVGDEKEGSRVVPVVLSVCAAGPFSPVCALVEATQHEFSAPVFFALFFSVQGGKGWEEGEAAAKRNVSFCRQRKEGCDHMAIPETWRVGEGGWFPRFPSRAHRVARSGGEAGGSTRTRCQARRCVWVAAAAVAGAGASSAPRDGATAGRVRGVVGGWGARWRAQACASPSEGRRRGACTPKKHHRKNEKRKMGAVNTHTHSLSL